MTYVVSMATSRKGLANVLEAVGQHSFKWRWAPNIAKSMFMKVKARRKGDRSSEVGNAVPLNLNGKPVSECEEYKYLGIVFENTLNWEKHVRRIRAKARNRPGSGGQGSAGTVSKGVRSSSYTSPSCDRWWSTEQRCGPQTPSKLAFWSRCKMSA